MTRENHCSFKSLIWVFLQVVVETLAESGAFDPDETGVLDEASGVSME